MFRDESGNYENNKNDICKFQHNLSHQKVKITVKRSEDMQ